MPPSACRPSLAACTLTDCWAQTSNPTRPGRQRTCWTHLWRCVEGWQALNQVLMVMLIMMVMLSMMVMPQLWLLLLLLFAAAASAP